MPNPLASQTVPLTHRHGDGQPRSGVSVGRCKPSIEFEGMSSRSTYHERRIEAVAHWMGQRKGGLLMNAAPCRASKLAAVRVTPVDSGLRTDTDPA
jgi:hypothetical protein